MISGVIYFYGKPMMVGAIPELHITPNTEDEKEPVPYFHPDSNECTFTMQLHYKNAKRTCLSLIYGRLISNNWLKMHGGTMIRKVSRRKHRLL